MAVGMAPVAVGYGAVDIGRIESRASVGSAEEDEEESSTWASRGAESRFTALGARLYVKLSVGVGALLMPRHPEPVGKTPVGEAPVG